MPAGSMLRTHMELWQPPCPTILILMEKLIGLTYREGKPSRGRWQGGTRVWSHVNSSEWSRSNKRGIYGWDRAALRYDICGKHRHYKTGCQDVGRETDRSWHEQIFKMWHLWGCWRREHWLNWGLIILVNSCCFRCGMASGSAFLFSEPLSFRDADWNIYRWNDTIHGGYLFRNSTGRGKSVGRKWNEIGQEL